MVGLVLFLFPLLRDILWRSSDMMAAFFSRIKVRVTRNAQTLVLDVVVHLPSFGRTSSYFPPRATLVVERFPPELLPP